MLERVRMTLFGKVSAGAGAVVIVVLAVYLGVVLKFDRLNRDVRGLYSENIPAAKKMSEIRESIVAQSAFLMRYAFFGRIKDSVGFRVERIKAERSLRGLHQILQEKPEMDQGNLNEQLEAFEGGWNDFADSSDRLMEAVRADYERETIRKLAMDVSDRAGRATEMMGTMIDLQSEMMDSAGASIERKAIITKRIILACGVLILAAGVGLTVFLGRFVAGPIYDAMWYISSASANLASASEYSAGCGHRIAQCSGEQAASMEETSSSFELLEEMSGRNADRAQAAGRALSANVRVVKNTVATAEQLKTSGNALRSSVERGSEAIECVNDVARRAGVLAGNAAVQAARNVGLDSGMDRLCDDVRGFAVFCAESAKKTVDLLAELKRHAELSVKNVDDVTDGLQGVSESSANVAEMVDSLVNAYREQARGISMVNRAVVELGTAVQDNAAEAEESAGSIEELSENARELKSLVADLDVIVRGGSREIASIPDHRKTGRFPWRRGRGDVDPKQDSMGADPVSADEILWLDDF